MFKQAYVRGAQNALIQSGHVTFPDEDTASKVADFIASRVNFEPTNGAVDRGITSKIGQALIDASNHLQRQPGFKAASFFKLATVEDLAKLAHLHALHLMEKAAEGSNIEGGDKGNAEPSSAEGKMDSSERPDGYAVLPSQGDRGELDTSGSVVGKEIPQPHQPSESPGGENSLTEHSRTASLSALIKKVAEGSTIHGGDKGNTEPYNAEGKMDQALRPQSYAVLPSQGALGEMMKLVKGPAVVGREIPQPVQPSESPSGTNSVTQHSAKAASEDPSYLELFKKTASEVGVYLPVGMNEDAKIAHVRACMGLSTQEKAYYLNELQRETADKTAAVQRPSTGHYNGRAQKTAEMPAFIQAKIDARNEAKGGDGKKDDDKKDENPFAKKDDDKKDDDKKDDDKKDDDKSASLRDHFRRIAGAIQPNA